MDDNKIKIDYSVMDETDEKPKKNKQARDWCFTVNNPVQTEPRIFRIFENGIGLALCGFSKRKSPRNGNGTLSRVF